MTEKEKYINTIYPGAVFTAKNYDPFTKKVLSHPFVCVYNQALDPDISGETNLLALLITSNNKQYERQIPILKAKNPFLEKDSFCYCNNIYMFLKTDVNIIGQMDSDTFFEVVKKRQLMLRGENDQCVQALMNMKAYESKFKQKERDKKMNASKEKPKNQGAQPNNHNNVNNNNHNNVNNFHIENNQVAVNKPVVTQSNEIKAAPLDPSRLVKKEQGNNNPNQNQPNKKRHFFRRKDKGRSPIGDIAYFENDKKGE